MEDVRTAANTGALAPGPTGFRRLLYFLNPLDSHHKREKRLLRVIGKRLQDEHKQLYVPLSGKLTAEFARELASLREGLLYFRGVFDLLSSDNVVAVHRKIANLLLHRKHVNLRSLNFDAIRAELEEATEASLVRAEDIEKVFEVRAAALSSIDYAGVQAAYTELICGAAVAAFDFDDLLGRFTKDTAGDAVRFGSVDAAQIIDELKDLHFVLDAYQPTPNGMKLLRLISGIANVSLVGGEEQTRAHYAKIHDALTRAIPSGFLADVIRMTATQPELQLDRLSTASRFLEEIRDTVLARFAAQIGEFKKAQAQKAFHQQIRQLFPEIELPEVDGYTRKINAALASVDFATFNDVMALRLVYAFVTHHYRDGIQPSLMAMAEKVEFNNDEDQRKLNEALLETGRLAAHISKFTEDLLDPQFSMLPATLAAITNNTIDDTSKSKFAAFVAQTNKRADGIIQSAVGNVSTLTDLLADTIRDVRSTTPDLVFNYRFLRETEPELLRHIEASIAVMNSFLAVMQNFAVNKQVLERRIAASKRVS